MNFNSMSKTVLAFVLSISLVTTGCSAQWISGTGRFAGAHPDGVEHRGFDVDAAVRKATDSRRGSGNSEHFCGSQQRPYTSAGALQFLQSQPEFGHSAENRQPDSGHQSQPPGIAAGSPHQRSSALSVRITAAVNLILTTVSSFASLIPPALTAAPRTARRNTAIPLAKDLKKQWNQQVCAPSGNAALDAALAERALK